MDNVIVSTLRVTALAVFTYLLLAITIVKNSFEWLLLHLPARPPARPGRGSRATRLSARSAEAQLIAE
jgi:hypothetical protein